MLGNLFLAALAAGIAGALLLVVATVVISGFGAPWWGVDPRQDGQYIVTYVLALPVGTLLGGAAGASLALWHHQHPRAGGIVCVAPGVFVLAVFTLWVWPNVLALWSPWSVVPVGAALVCTLWGLRLLGGWPRASGAPRS